MASAQVVETSAANNSPAQDSRTQLVCQDLRTQLFCFSFFERKNIGRLNQLLTKKGKLNELKRQNRFAVERCVCLYLCLFLFFALRAVVFI